MFNFLRMDFYRMVHSKTTWVFVGVIVASVILITGMMGYLTSDAFTELYTSAQVAAAKAGADVTMSTPGSQPGMSFSATASPGASLDDPAAMLTGSSMTFYLGNMFLSGGALAVLTTLYIALFLTSEFDSGFAKNIFTARTNRFSFFASKAVFMLLIAVAFAALSFGLACLGSFLVDLKLEMMPPLDFALWFALVVLVLFAFEMIVSLVAWFTRSKVAAILVATFVGGSVVFQIISLICQFIPAMKEVPNFMLSGCLSSLAHAGAEVAGPLGSVHVAGVAVAFLAVFAIASMFVLKKKDI